MFYAYLSGGGGCDYTMGCNKKLIQLRSQTFDAATKEVAILADDYEQYVDDIQILDVTNTTNFDLKGHKELQKKQEAEQRAESQLEADRRRYEELKRRFES